MVTFGRGTAFLLLAFLTSLAACRPGRGDNSVREAFENAPATPDLPPSLAFRFPSEAGPGVRLYTLPALQEVEWRFEMPTLATQQVVGFAAAEDQIYVRTTAQELVALDLESGRDRGLDTAVVAATIGPTGVPYLVRKDGSVATVVDRRTRDWEPLLPNLPQSIWGTTRGRLLALFDLEHTRHLEVLGDSSRRISTELPRGLFTTTTWGDLIVIAVDSGLIAWHTVDGSEAGFLPLASEVTAMTFSSSAHRLYVTTAAPELLVVERFRFQILTRYPLPVRVEAMRTGPLGRYMLLHPARRDSVWIADALQLFSPHSVAGTWDDELPSIAPDATVLLRHEGDVIAIDPATGLESGRVADAADDRWLAIAWDPRRPALLLAQQADPTPVEPTDQTTYVQLSSTSNESWAQARVDELLEARLPARVLQPTEHYDRYRVVLGPYGTREDADNIGRRLGQPYFIIFLDSTATNR